MLVLVVTKNVREGLRISVEFALRAGLDMAGAEAPFPFSNFAAWLKPCPDTELRGMIYDYASYRASRRDM
jgi:hypothetical protein